MSVDPRRPMGCGLVFGIALALTVAACSTSGEAPRPTSINLAGQPFPTKVTAHHDDVQLPWHLIRIDTSQNRVYLSASTSRCTTPAFAVLTENAAVGDADAAAAAVLVGRSTGSTRPPSSSSLTVLRGHSSRGGLLWREQAEQHE